MGVLWGCVGIIIRQCGVPDNMTTLGQCYGLVGNVGVHRHWLYVGFRYWPNVGFVLALVGTFHGWLSVWFPTIGQQRSV